MNNAAAAGMLAVLSLGCASHPSPTGPRATDRSLRATGPRVQSHLGIVPQLRRAQRDRDESWRAVRGGRFLALESLRGTEVFDQVAGALRWPLAGRLLRTDTADHEVAVDDGPRGAAYLLDLSTGRERCLRARSATREALDLIASEDGTRCLSITHAAQMPSRDPRIVLYDAASGAVLAEQAVPSPQDNAGVGAFSRGAFARDSIVVLRRTSGGCVGCRNVRPVTTSELGLNAADLRPTGPWTTTMGGLGLSDPSITPGATVDAAARWGDAVDDAEVNEPGTHVALVARGRVALVSLATGSGEAVPMPPGHEPVRIEGFLGDGRLVLRANSHADPAPQRAAVVTWSPRERRAWTGSIEGASGDAVLRVAPRGDRYLACDGSGLTGWQCRVSVFGEPTARWRESGCGSSMFWTPDGAALSCHAPTGVRLLAAEDGHDLSPQPERIQSTVVPRAAASLDRALRCGVRVLHTQTHVQLLDPGGHAFGGFFLTPDGAVVAYADGWWTGPESGARWIAAFRPDGALADAEQRRTLRNEAQLELALRARLAGCL